MKKLILTVAILINLSFAGFSQSGIPNFLQGFSGEVFKLSGDIVTYGELYSISGREQRRPSSTARLFFRPTISIYNLMSVSFNFLLSTQGNTRSFQHQINQINQFGIQPKWAWGYANAGDFSESYTPYTLNGILVRGGSITINPGLLRFSAIGGYTRRTNTFGGTGKFDRYLYGGRIGVGNKESYFDVIFLRVRDTPSKFHIVVPDSIPVLDSTQVGTISNPYQDTPQENLVFGIATSLNMFEDAVNIQAEVNGSAYTRDMTSSRINQVKVPSIISTFYTPRLSTNSDYEYNIKMNFNLYPAILKAGYRYIGPGYKSLGVASLITDQREISIGTGLRFSKWSMMLNWSRQNDNLLKQKLSTTVRQAFGGNIMIRPLDIWSMGITGNILTMRNYLNQSANLVDFYTLNLGTTHSVMINREGLFRNFSLSYIFQKSKDNNPLRAQNGFTSNMITSNVLLIPLENFTVQPSGSIVASKIGIQPVTYTETLSTTAYYRTLANKLVASLTIGLTRYKSVASLQTNLSAIYRLTDFNTITVSLRRNGYQSYTKYGTDYSEYTASITMTQKL